MGYDFSTLSPADFEDLSGDLLQAELGVRLEAFTVGRDGGTDLRYAATPGRKWIVQCKHFARSGWNSLASQLKREAPKVLRLAPERYLLTTTVGLTPANKDEILRLLSPWIRSTEDVFGADDIRNLLRRHPRVETAHFKLWLGSAAVLDRILQAATFARTDSLKEELQRQVRLYASNESFERSIDVLSKNRVCIIAGIPGIGKTFLARMLMLHHMAQDFEAFAVSADIEEANRLYRSEQSQFFYYDDFLGTAFDQALAKNEDARLSEFVQRVARTPNKRLVLTTREYILKNAIARYERLHQSLGIDLQCIVKLEDYTRLVRGKVIYNHLYFSTLSRPTVRAFCQGRYYQRVIRHPSFSPRLVEFTIRQAEKERMGPDAFRSFVDSVLSTPATLWDHAFRSQLPVESQAVLLAMLFLPVGTPVNDLSSAATSLAAVRNGLTISGMEVTARLKQLDGTFARIDAGGGALPSARHMSPAIADYLLGVLDATPAEISGIVKAAVFFEQVVGLWSAGQASEDGPPRFPGLHRWLRDNMGTFCAALARTFREPSCQWREHYVGQERGVERIPPNVEQRLLKVLEIADAERALDLKEWAIRELGSLESMWVRHEGDRASAAELIRLVKVSDQAREAVKSWSLSEIEDAHDFEAAARLCETASDLVDEVFLAALGDAFQLFVESQVDFILHDANDASAADSAMDDVTDLARRLDMDPGWDEDELRARIARLEEREDRFDPDIAREAHGVASDRNGGPWEDRKIDLLFDSLDRALDSDESEER